jgi:hypothetical protein
VAKSRKAGDEAPKDVLWYVGRLQLSRGESFLCRCSYKAPHFLKDTDNEDVNMDAAPAFAYDANKNAHLKGRKRFTADLSDIQEASLAGLVFSGLKLQS